MAKGYGAIRDSGGRRVKVGNTVQVGGAYTPIIRGTVLSIGRSGVTIRPTNVRPGSFADRPALIPRNAGISIVG
jgi:hypothetical protein